MGELAEMNKTGDTKSQWDRNNAAEVAAARATFDTLRGKGFAAYKLTGDGSRGEQLLTFDPAAERIIMVPAFQGG